MYKARLARNPHQQLSDYLQKRKYSMQGNNFKLQFLSKQTNNQRGLGFDLIPYQNFLRSQSHISAQSDPLDFRQLPRNLKVFFPGPPNPPPVLQQIPYTYQKVPLVPVKMPKQQKGTVGSWVLEQSGFVQRRSRSDTQQKKIQPITKFAKNVSQKKVLKKMNAFGQTGRKDSIKKSSICSKSQQFFQMVKAGKKQVQYLLQTSPYLAFNVDQNKMTALHIAAHYGYSYLTKVLLQKFRANPQAKDYHGRTPIHLAILKKHFLCIVLIFIEGGQLKTLDGQKRYAFMMAPDQKTKNLLEKLEEVKFIVRSRGFRDQNVYKIQLEKHIKFILDESSIHF